MIQTNTTLIFVFFHQVLLICMGLNDSLPGFIFVRPIITLFVPLLSELIWSLDHRNKRGSCPLDEDVSGHVSPQFPWRLVRSGRILPTLARMIGSQDLGPVIWPGRLAVSDRYQYPIAYHRYHVDLIPLTYSPKAQATDRAQTNANYRRSDPYAPIRTHPPTHLEGPPFCEGVMFEDFGHSWRSVVCGST